MLLGAALLLWTTLPPSPPSATNTGDYTVEPLPADSLDVLPDPPALRLYKRSPW